MAGKIEKRINDRFYFVLDEVGASSDIESEPVIDNESKSVKNPADQGIDLLKERDKENAVMTTGNQETNNATELARDIPSGQTEDTNNDNGIDEGEIVDDASSPNDENSQESGDAKINNEEPPVGIVDMDVDSEADSVDASNPVKKIAPIIKLTFRDEAAEKSLKDSILKFLSLKLKPCTVVTNSENSLEIEIFEEDTDKIIEEDLLDFTVDTTPDQHLRNSRIPYYGRPHNVILSDKNDDKSNKNSAAPVSSCFNCLGNHNLRDCTKPKDFKAINRNRASKMNNKSSRYHLDENQKFSHIVPGEISKKLRGALNLHKDQQPEFFYRMRKLGYPPAWLEEARISHSGVAMYNNTGVPVLEEDEEEGEIIPEGAKDRYDITKIIEFPGFNVPLPKNMKEEGKYYKCPPISEEQSKEHMIKELQPNAAQAYRKRSLKPALSSEEQSPGPSTSTSKRSSPTIEEMEERKRQLLMALDDESDSKLSQDTSSSVVEPELEAVKEPVLSTPAKKVGVTKNLDLGTPILKSVSPFSKLPAREQFSVNVSDVINFENLPNSTGKYETMTHLITKIRKFRDEDTKNESKEDVSMS